MTLSETLQSTNHMLSAAGIEDADIEAELLLCHLLRISKTQLYAERERLLNSAEAKSLQQLIQRRLLHEPTAYILRHCEFYGIGFYVDYRTFIPRPETELLVEKAIEFAHQFWGRQFTIADIGTGCGAIAISLALAFPQARIYATDVSTSALEVAEINLRLHKVGCQVELLQGNLLEPLPRRVDMIVANLPYIKNWELETLSPEIINFEPVIALAGGEDGLDKMRQLLEQARGKINSGGCLLLEIGQGQGKAVSSLINSYFPQANIGLVTDLGGIDRVVVAQFIGRHNLRLQEG
jgi:release factor glutamine methyltransferase